MEQTNTIKIADAIFNFHCYGRFNRENSNIYLWLPYKESDIWIAHNRITNKNIRTNFFNTLFFALEHEILHMILNELENFETSSKLDNLVNMVKELDLKGEWI